ncbi:hypothetical protein J2S74_005425 [Evansella vedderi]|uniref:Uncharacterized protein n=1 Tax=Evansella vedderi TaxID=38282 RepID=A0ABU0A3A3_9BACI|nr:hypothetical protein [Evansella vedderi]MDQ0257962.1 hypothetical protein [Evansella vedderi]
MARKDKSLSGFGDVAKINKNDDNNNKANANDDKKGDVNNNTKNNANNDVNVNVSEEGKGDYIDELLEGKKKKSDETVMTGIYLEKDLADILARLAKKGGRGTKSKVVNEALRKVFQEKGIL